MSVETTTDDSTALNQNDDTEYLPNPERGCGFLKDGKAYLRADTAVGGELPAFVEFTQPIPFKEDNKRSYKQFPGVQFELSVTGEAGITATEPANEIQNHLDRLVIDRPTGTTAGEMVSFHSHDLLMSVGKSYYETADEFIEEAKAHGVNKAISVTSKNRPPVVNPGRTRLFLIHPHAVETTVAENEEQEVEQTEIVELPNGEAKTISYTETQMVEVEKTEYQPGVIGYTYLTRVVYTEDADGNVPKYIQDYEATGSLDVVKAGRPIPYSEQEGFDGDGEPVEDEQATISEYPEMKHRPFVMAELDDLYPALEMPLTEDMEKADLGLLSDAEQVKGWAPPEGQDAFSGDDDGVLALVREHGEVVKITPSNNVSIEGEKATSVVGPYRLVVEDLGHGKRMITAEKTR